MNDHFQQIYRYIVGITVFVCAYTTAITFMPLPETGTRFADIALGFFFGTLLSAGAGFLLGGSALINKKPPMQQGTTTAEVTANITTTPEQQPENKTE